MAPGEGLGKTTSVAVAAGARKRGENRIVGRLFEFTVIWAIELGEYYSNISE
jgi:hypothetical protein